MSVGERIQRPGTPTANLDKEHEDPLHSGNSVEADRAWAQNRVANFFRGQRVMRKADGEPAAHDGQDAQVSQPGEPAEKEADAVADQVADQLHGGAGKPGGEHPRGPKQPAPSIGAMPQPGAVSLAGKNGGGGQAPAWKNVAASSSRRTHILVGDATGGGHSHRATVPGKSKFPAGWTDDKIIAAIETVANTAANYPGGKFPQPKGPKSRYLAEATVDGIAIKVVVEPLGEGIITGHPK
jgi:hypothetical protein